MARQITKRQSKRAKQLDLDIGYTALYIRVSTEKQADAGFSLEAQEKALRAFCEAHGWQICEEHIYIDAGITGKSADRSRFQAMLQAAQVGAIRRIVAMKLDRLARNVRDFLSTVDLLKDSGCALVLIKESFDTSTPHGKFALTMFAAMAELEASTERVMSGKTQKATTGGYNGSRIPLGYDYTSGKWRKNIHASTVKGIFKQFVEGETLQAIADRLNGTATPTARGGQWYTSTVRYILCNGFYAGLSQWNETEVAGTHPAIISRDLYEAAIRRLKELKPGPRARVD